MKQRNKIIVGLMAGLSLIGGGYCPVNAESVATSMAQNVRQDKQNMLQGNGIMLDVARHPMNFSQLMQVVRVMNPNKFQYLQLHLNDDSFCAYRNRRLGTMNQRQGYTDRELSELVDLANEHHIKLVLDFDLPGHSTYLVKRLREYQPRYANQLISSDGSINYTSPLTFEWARSVYQQLASDLRWQSQKAIMVGGDEVDGGIANNQALISFFNQIDDTLQQADCKTLVWNDNLGVNSVQTLNPDIVVDYWSQSGMRDSNRSTMNQMRMERVSAQELVGNHELINANSDTHYIEISDLDKPSYDAQWIQRFNQSETNSFNVINMDDENQNIIVDCVNPGQLVCLWGENSSKITDDEIVTFIKDLNA